MVLIVALLTSTADRHQTQRALLDGLFEQAPQAVALMSGDGRVVRINREFTRLFGFTPQEVLADPGVPRDVGQCLLDDAVDGEAPVVEVEDRGAGFDQEQVADAFGPTVMRERATILGGRRIIETSPGAGTRIVAELPL